MASVEVGFGLLQLPGIGRNIVPVFYAITRPASMLGVSRSAGRSDLWSHEDVLLAVFHCFSSKAGTVQVPTDGWKLWLSLPLSQLQNRRGQSVSPGLASSSHWNHALCSWGMWGICKLHMQ